VTTGVTPARLALVDEARELLLAVATTTADDAELDAVRATLADVRERLSAGRAERMPRTPFEAPREAWQAGRPYRLSALNPFGVPLDIVFEDGKATARLVADARHEGPPDSLHGGISAWLMDSMLGMLMQVRGRRGVTGTLDLRYVRRTPLDVPLTLRSWISRTEGRKVWIEGSIEADGAVTVTAQGLFIEIEGAGRGSQ